jgi:hypothetical protein
MAASGISWPVAAIFVNGSEQMTNRYRENDIDASYQISILPSGYRSEDF